MNPETEQLYLKICLQKIEEKAILGERLKWGQAQLQHLSEEIYEASKISVSTDTIRRLFGKTKMSKEYYNPHRETKNALAIYLGFVDWRSFTKSNKLPEIEATTKFELW